MIYYFDMDKNIKWYNLLDTCTKNVKLTDKAGVKEISRVIIIHKSHHTDVNGNNISLCQKMEDVERSMLR